VYELLCDAAVYVAVEFVEIAINLSENH